MGIRYSNGKVTCEGYIVDPDTWTVLVIDQLAEPLILGSDFMTANNISLSSMQCGMTCLV